MRGHLGFRVPRAPFLETRLTQFSLSSLEYQDPTKPNPRVTQFSLDTLTYVDPAQNIVKMTHYLNDVLTYTAQQNEPRITLIAIDVLTHNS